MKNQFFKNILILAVVNLTKSEGVDTSDDSIIIKSHLENKPGGATLDVSGIDAKLYPFISAGHPVIKETATGLFKALGITNGAFAAKPSGHTWEGVVRATVETERAMVSIMTRGTVNPEAFKNSTKRKYELASGLEIPADLITNKPLIIFDAD